MIDILVWVIVGLILLIPIGAAVIAVALVVKLLYSVRERLERK